MPPGRWVAEYRFGSKLDELTVALERLVDRHSGGRLFRIKKKWREAQGVIRGKRCGTSQSQQVGCQPCRTGR